MQDEPHSNIQDVIVFFDGRTGKDMKERSRPFHKRGARLKVHFLNMATDSIRASPRSWKERKRLVKKKPSNIHILTFKEEFMNSLRSLGKSKPGRKKELLPFTGLDSIINLVVPALNGKQGHLDEPVFAVCVTFDGYVRVLPLHCQKEAYKTRMEKDNQELNATLKRLANQYGWRTPYREFLANPDLLMRKKDEDSTEFLPICSSAYIGTYSEQCKKNNIGMRKARISKR